MIVSGMERTTMKESFRDSKRTISVSKIRITANNCKPYGDDHPSCRIFELLDITTLLHRDTLRESDFHESRFQGIHNVRDGLPYESFFRGIGTILPVLLR